MTPADEDELGPCCVCGGSTGESRNVVMLSVRNLVPGHGWGCVVCGLPPNGATAVVCDDCVDDYSDGAAPLRFACRGYPGTEGRVPIGELVEPHNHDFSRHAENDLWPKGRA